MLTQQTNEQPKQSQVAKFHRKFSNNSIRKVPSLVHAHHATPALQTWALPLPLGIVHTTMAWALFDLALLLY